MEPGDPLERLSGSISDGTPVDWQGGEGAALDSDTAEAMRQVERIAEFHRSLQRVASPPAPQLPTASLGEAPERWGALTLLERIGAGAQGQVWRAWDATLQRQVALKFLQGPEPPGNSGTQADLLNEARALARIRHSGVVAVYGIDEHEGRLGMWMECVPGTTLAREIDRLGALSAEQVARIALQLCSALEAVELAGLVHRDIKPANIILEGEDRVVLTDFGLGWRPAIDRDAAPRVSGTPMFMAPELLAGGEPTHQSDLYALGVTLWWALAGKSPFVATTIQELMRESAEGPATPLHEICPGAPRALTHAISWAMKPSAAQRPGNATEMAVRLRPVLHVPADVTSQQSPADRGLKAAVRGAFDATQGLRHFLRAVRRPRRPGAAPASVSVAVLPFANRTRSEDEEYFSDGLADELISMLAKIPGLRVAARTSSFTFKGRQVTVGEIGRALNVATVLDGSVRKVGNRVRISVQLVKTEDGYHIWSETFDRLVGDLYAVQDDIAHSVVSELRRALLGETPGPDASREVQTEIARAARGRATDPEAYRLYLLGRHRISRLTREEVARGVDCIKEALAVDPRFALAWTELGGAYVRAAGRGFLPREEGYEQARNAIRQALSIEPDLPEAHARMARIQAGQDWDWKGAEGSYQRAFAVSPGDAELFRGAAVLASIQGRFGEAIERYRQSLEQDPLSAMTYQNYGLTLQRAGRVAEAEAALRKAIELEPKRYLSHAFLAQVLLEQKRFDEALAEAQAEPDAGERLFVLSILYHAMGRESEAGTSLRELIESHGQVYAFQIAEICAARGDADASFEWLERAYAQRDSGLAETRSSVYLQPLRNDSRWPAFAAKMRFDPEAREA